MADKFERIEKKYLITEQELNLLLTCFNGHLSMDKYGVQTIVSIYFDDPFHYNVSCSLSSPVYKEKLRLRSYGTPKDDTKVFLELKKKYKGIVYKRRVELPYKEVLEYLETGKPGDSQIFKEIDYTKKLFNMQPAIYIAYDRFALCNQEDTIRITFDTNIRFRLDNLTLSNDSNTINYWEDKMYLMEIKTNGAMPQWMVDALNSNKIYPSTFSKYGKIFEKFLA